MQYRINQKNGEQLSQLGLGCMRFPRKGTKVDQIETNRLVSAAIDLGINYFDTAYIYPGSEAALGTALEADGRRDEVFIATKLPHYMCKSYEDFDRIFNAQLSRLRTDRIDYYLIHMLSNVKAWDCVKSLGVAQWIKDKLDEGQICNIGFSFHGGRMEFIELLDVFDWDFCMVQMNYYDEFNQATMDGVREAYKRKIPVIVMEPLRGGLLAVELPSMALRAFRNVNKGRSPAEWAFRWLFDKKEILLALSGMSCVEQLNENVTVANDAMPDKLTEPERAAYDEVVKILNGTVKNPCTACGYCSPCPRGVSIPNCFSCYNKSYSQGRVSGLSEYVKVCGLLTSVRTDASRCNACGKCLSLCPQKIEIPKELKKVKRRMLYFIIAPLMAFMRKQMGVRE